MDRPSSNGSFGEEWGPYIDHDGSGYPGYPDGTLMELKLATPWNGMKHFGTIPVIIGQYFEDSGIDVAGDPKKPDSWTLPIKKLGILYIYRYRVWRPRALRKLIGIAQRVDVEVRIHV